MANGKIVNTVLIGGMEFAASTPSGHTIFMDAAEAGGGENNGPRPTELVLAGLGGCPAMDVISILRKMREPVEGLEVSVNGEQANEHPHRFTNIHIEYVVYGSGITPANVEKAIRLSDERYCSVAATLRGVATITHSYRIEPAPVKAAV